MKDVPRNSFGLFDSPVRCREKERVSLTPRHIESQLDAGAFLMSSIRTTSRIPSSWN